MFGTGKFANLYALRTSEMAGFVNVVKLFSLSASKNNISYYVIPVTMCFYLPNLGHKRISSVLIRHG